MPLKSLSNHPTLYVCEADIGASHPLVKYLIAKRFAVRCIASSDQAIDQIITGVPDLVVLDAHLPMAGGYEVCNVVRPYYSGPILIQGLDRDDAAHLMAFERGADDYIPTPVTPLLLTARINAHLRRSHAAPGESNGRRIRVGELVVDAGLRAVSLAGRPIGLTTTQFELLWYLTQRSGRVVPREELYQSLYRQKYNGVDRSVDVNISRIRHQLGDDVESPNYLKTVRGVGYQFINRNGEGR